MDVIDLVSICTNEPRSGSKGVRSVVAVGERVIVEIGSLVGSSSGSRMGESNASLGRRMSVMWVYRNQHHQSIA
jgi:hypothetical protein